MKPIVKRENHNLTPTEKSNDSRFAREVVDSKPRKLIIGLVGEKGSGKETFGDLLQELLPKKTFFRVRSSDILTETLEDWDIPKTRSNLQHLAIVMDSGFGDGTLSHAVRKRMEQSKSDIIIFDGVRWQTDADMVKSFPNSFLIYVTADLEVRFQRLKSKSKKVAEQGLSFEQFMKEEKIKTELEIPKIGANADFKAINNGTLEELKKQVQDFTQKYI